MPLLVLALALAVVQVQVLVACRRLQLARQRERRRPRVLHPAHLHKQRPVLNSHRQCRTRTGTATTRLLACWYVAVLGRCQWLGAVVLTPVCRVAPRLQVHSGTAQSGHYYSFVKDRSDGPSAGSWFRFDDTRVTPFDPDDIEAECFGGVTQKRVRQGQREWFEDVPICKNAFLLFYERDAPFDPNPPASSVKVPPTPKRPAGRRGSDSKAEEPLAVARVPTLEQSLEERWQENERVLRQQHRFDSKLFEFLAHLARQRADELSASRRALAKQRADYVARSLVHCFMYTFIRAKDAALCTDMLPAMRALLTHDVASCRELLLHAIAPGPGASAAGASAGAGSSAARKSMLERLLLECTAPTPRLLFSQLLAHAVGVVANDDAEHRRLLAATALQTALSDARQAAAEQGRLLRAAIRREKVALDRLAMFRQQALLTPDARQAALGDGPSQAAGSDGAATDVPPPGTGAAPQSGTDTSDLTPDAQAEERGLAAELATCAAAVAECREQSHKLAAVAKRAAVDADRTASVLARFLLAWQRLATGCRAYGHTSDQFFALGLDVLRANPAMLTFAARADIVHDLTVLYQDELHRQPGRGLGGAYSGPSLRPLLQLLTFVCTRCSDILPPKSARVVTDDQLVSPLLADAETEQFGLELCVHFVTSKLDAARKALLDDAASREAATTGDAGEAESKQAASTSAAAASGAGGAGAGCAPEPSASGGGGSGDDSGDVMLPPKTVAAAIRPLLLACLRQTWSTGHLTALTQVRCRSIVLCAPPNTHTHTAIVHLCASPAVLVCVQLVSSPGPHRRAIIKTLLHPGVGLVSQSALRPQFAMYAARVDAAAGVADRHTLNRAASILLHLLATSPLVRLHMEQNMSDWAWLPKRAVPRRYVHDAASLPLALPSDFATMPGRTAASLYLMRCADLFRVRLGVLEGIRQAAGVPPKPMPMPAWYVHGAGVEQINGRYLGLPGDTNDGVQRFQRRAGRTTLHLARFFVKGVRYWFITNMGGCVHRGLWVAQCEVACGSVAHR